MREAPLLALPFFWFISTKRIDYPMDPFEEDYEVTHRRRVGVGNAVDAPIDTVAIL